LCPIQVVKSALTYIEGAEEWSREHTARGLTETELEAAIADPDRFACEPKVDGVRGLLVFDARIAPTRRFRGVTACRRTFLCVDTYRRSPGS